MKLIVGLGNPGKEYENTRHNLGFLVVDRLASDLDLNFKTQGLSLVAKTNIDGESVIVAKPQTFMNRSGFAVKELIDYYDIDIEDIIVVVDDKDQLNGNFKLKKVSGHGGQNGIRNIIDILKTDDFKRLKVGVGAEKISDTAKYVLGNFNSEQRKEIESKMNMFVDIVKDSTKLSFTELANKYNGR